MWSEDVDHSVDGLEDPVYVELHIRGQPDGEVVRLLQRAAEVRNTLHRGGVRFTIDQELPLHLQEDVSA